MFFHVARCVVYSITSYFKPKLGIRDVCLSRIYVGFRKMDGFLHVNNSRYLEIFEFARWQQGVRSGLLQYKFVKKGYPVVNSVHVHYLTPLFPFKFVTVETKVVGRHDRILLMEQRILAEPKPGSDTRRCYASALVKISFMGPSGKTVDLEEAFKSFEKSDDLPLIPESRSGDFTVIRSVDRPTEGQQPTYCAAINAGDDLWRQLERDRSPSPRHPKS